MNTAAPELLGNARLCPLVGGDKVARLIASDDISAAICFSRGQSIVSWNTQIRPKRAYSCTPRSSGTEGEVQLAIQQGCHLFLHDRRVLSHARPSQTSRPKRPRSVMGPIGHAHVLALRCLQQNTTICHRAQQSVSGSNRELSISDLTANGGVPVILRRQSTVSASAAAAASSAAVGSVRLMTGSQDQMLDATGAYDRPSRPEAEARLFLRAGSALHAGQGCSKRTRRASDGENSLQT